MPTSKIDGSTQLQFSDTLDLGVGSSSDRRIVNLSDPVSDADATNKQYVDTLFANMDAKASVAVSTTENIDLSSAPSAIDGVTLSNNDRVLVKDQTDASENGLYSFSSAGSAMSRTADANSNSEVTAGLYVFVESGTTHGDSAWVLITNGTISLGSTNLTFEEFTVPDTAITESSLVVREQPSGDLNGSNVTFVLNNTPISNMESIYLNGSLLRPGSEYDYTISNQTITLVTAPESDDNLLATYVK